ncbi:MAG: manganese efflux pump, partial [Erysipelotrichaceae bacterium]|nr:manganese efflux pump [Erysipelotrichaceae bacterium]
MKLLEVFFLSVGLAMDAFAVSVCKGLALKKATVREWLTCGVWFGLFQGLMPLLGYLLGSGFATIINAIAPWLAFILLSIIGINMIREAFGSEEEADDDLGFKTMLMLAIATSIDAFAIGITFVAIPVRILDASALTNTLLAVSMIAIITLIISSLGVMIGHKFGTVYQSGAQVMGGTILLFIGLNSLISSLDKFDLMNDPDTIFGLLIPLIGTVIGASFAFLKNNRISSNTNSILSGLSAGTMLALSARALLNPLIDKESETSLPFLVSLFVFFWLGVLIQYALDR